MKTYDELKRTNRSYRLAELLAEMPAAEYWRKILDEVSENLREKGDGEIHLERCFQLDAERMAAGHYDNQGRLTAAGEKAQELESLK